MVAIVEQALMDRDSPNLRSRAYDSFTRHLLARDLRAGQFISQRELVEMTQLPLAAIREMIPRLEAEGLVRTVPNRGMQIPHVDLGLIREAFQLRLFLEREAVASFTRTASDETIAALEREHQAIIDECRAAAGIGGITAAHVQHAQDIDWSLHTSIINALNNSIIADIYRVNSIKIRLIKQEQTRLNETVLLPTMEEHLAVIAAIRSRDPQRAADAMGDHVNSARDRAMGLR
ncbi:GntR family transcriptional regulator [Roseomonas gilardii]|uniref:GntR family transcriptional regulator n=2 Tax=Roseomonas gilardii TaxID=257708 RepID=A0ABU3MKE4_9PROT|nr:GntR family transcriptional regulator [Roseomonas gilardii]MDT8332800.1 GntR family transcriptional regulator [Roseomonas gilardii]